MSALRSRAGGTKRTILSPFTKEYRVFPANSGIRQFFQGPLPLEDALHYSTKFFNRETQKTPHQKPHPSPEATPSTKPPGTLQAPDTSNALSRPQPRGRGDGVVASSIGAGVAVSEGGEAAVEGADREEGGGDVLVGGAAVAGVGGDGV
ncbi:monocarboxylate transporter 9 [Senna tora]|uniref:Monocarboxylate transporter 9 n=1 Tax=Senna tora TaxID=362788 RepID=A0A834X2Q5_9FABA|nr:monocarboxylate transporter 9 [Senna tora]